MKSIKFILCLTISLLLIGTVSASTTVVINPQTSNASDTDAFIERVAGGANWVNIRDGAGNSIDTTETTIGVNMVTFTSSTYYKLRRGVLLFNTSTLPDDAVISSATISLYSQSTSTATGDAGIDITKFTIDGTITADDYDNFGNDVFSGYQNISALPSGSWYTWDLNAIGIANITLTGESGFMVRNQYDIENIPYPWVNSSTSSFVFRAAEFTNYAPKLTITYDAPVVAAFSASATSGSTPLSVTLSDTSAGTPNNWDWYWYDNETKSSDDQNPVVAFTSGTYDVRLYASNGLGGTWHNETGYISVSGYSLRPRAVTAMPTISESRYNAIVNTVGLNNTSGSGAAPNWTGLVQESVGVYTDALGPFALILLFLIPFAMMWIANRNMKGVAIVGILVSLFVFLYLPSNYQAAALICIGVAAAALIWSLFKQQ